MSKKSGDNDKLPLTNEELTIELLKTLNTNIAELVKVSKDIDYKLWVYAKNDGFIK
jgi:hypothetical protein